jgi:hypothetical protein
MARIRVVYDSSYGQIEQMNGWATLRKLLFGGFEP